MGHLITLVGGRGLHLPEIEEFQATYGNRPLFITSRNNAGIVSLEPGYLCAILSTSGTLTVDLAENTYTVASRRVFLATVDAPMRLVANPGSSWIGMVLPIDLVRDTTISLLPAATAENLLFASVHERARPVARAIIQLLRQARNNKNPPSIADTRAMLSDFMHTAIALQEREFGPLIVCCPGRTLAAKRLSFSRLLRVRQWVEREGSINVPVNLLAHMSSYSKFHFIRVFRRVFGQTPHEFVTRIRLERVVSVMAREGTAISDAARTAGFENRCSFSRLFRQHFGMSASEFRRRRRNGAIMVGDYASQGALSAS